MRLDPITSAGIAIAAAQQDADYAHAAGAKREDYQARQVGALQGELRKLARDYADFRGDSEQATLGCYLSVVRLGPARVLVEWAPTDSDEDDAPHVRFHPDNIDVRRAYLNGEWVDVGDTIEADDAWCKTISESAMKEYEDSEIPA